MTTGYRIARVFYICVALGFCLPSWAEEKPAGVSEESYADFMATKVLDVQDLAEGAEIQRRMFNRMTPSEFSWLQPMFPSVAPFDAKYFDGSFLDGLLGEETNSVAVYPLSLVLDPKTRNTLIYNAEGELIATVPADGVSRTWPEDADPARVTLRLDLLPSEDVEPYLYVEDRIGDASTSMVSKSAKTPKAGGVVMMNMMVGNTNFGILSFQRLTNGNMRLTVTNGADVAEVFSYTVWHTSTVVVTNWLNEESNEITSTNIIWTPTSPPFNGLESMWECQETNLVLTSSGAVWEDSNISSNARVKFYGVAKKADRDWDGLTDGAELFVHHTSPTNADTDGDGWSDGEEIAAETDPLDRFSATHLARGVVINEVLYNPDQGDPEKEWVELYSASRYPVELSGFSIQVASNTFSNAYVFPTNTWIQPGHYLLLGGTNVANRDLTVSFAIPNCYTNEPTGAVRLVAEISTNTLVADTLMYGGNPLVFNSYGLDTTGWLSTNVPWALAGSSVVRWFAGVDSDRNPDWTWATTPTPSSSTNSIDSDGDGLTDQVELTGSSNIFHEATNPHNADSDGDGLGDYGECVTYGTNPNTWATDGDLFPWPPTNNVVSNWWGSDSYELANGWNPLVYDENTNGIPDSWEMAFPGTNLYADADNDKILNYDELVQNSNPFNSNSVSPQAYVVVFQSSKPGWVNSGLIDVGLKGWVKIYFEGLKTNTCLGVWVKECSTQEEFRVDWVNASPNGEAWLNNNREVITSASAAANSHPYLLIQDLGWHPGFIATLGGEYTNAIIKVEFDHNKVNTRNLTHTQDDFPYYDHCIALTWDGSQSVDLADYLTAESLAFTNYVDWYVNDTKQSSSTYSYDDEPGANEIEDLAVEVKCKDGSTVMDRLIVTVVPDSTVQSYNTWFTQWSANTAWLAELPAAYSALPAGNADPEPGTCTNQYWEGVDAIDSFYHPGAVFEMRSEETPNGHGHQACYTGGAGGGTLITSGMAAGSADSHHYSDVFTPSHRTEDVLPFVLAAQLDGNPVWVNDLFPVNMNRPMMYEGTHLQQYMQVRPPVPNSKPLLAPEACGP